MVGGAAIFGWASATSGGNFGVIGESDSSAGYGVFSTGRSGASGTKSFRIDHPLDPENKYLLHYSAEGPEPLNVYSGVAVMDPGGSATVQLPPYFASINKEPRYQLTCIGGFAQVYIAAEIDQSAAPSSFTIAGGRQGLRVSWEVKAVRNDLWVRKHGAPIELDKPENERGRYEHPDLYGQPAERSVFPAQRLISEDRAAPNPQTESGGHE